MFGFGKQTKPPETLLAKAQVVALSYQGLAITKLDGNIPPGLLGMIWSLTCHVHEKMFEARRMLDRDSGLRFQILAGEAFALHAMGGLGSMGPAEVEEAKLIFDECLNESRGFLNNAGMLVRSRLFATGQRKMS